MQCWQNLKNRNILKSEISLDVFIQVDMFPVKTVGHHWNLSVTGVTPVMREHAKKFSETPFKSTVDDYLILRRDIFRGQFWSNVPSLRWCRDPKQTHKHHHHFLFFFHFVIVPHISLVAFPTKQGRRARCIFESSVST